MLILIAKLLAATSLPLLATVLWKIRSRAAWACAIAALAAIVIYSLVRIPLWEYVVTTPLLLPEGYQFPPRITVQSVAIAFIYGTVRESIQWLIMRFRAAKLITWQDGVLFGFTYAAAAVVPRLIEYFERQLIRTAVGLGTTPPVGNQTPFEMIASLRERPLEMVIDQIVLALPWGAVILLFFQWSIIPMVFNVGTSLAVLYSVRQRKAWPFGAAILCYMTVTIASSSGLENLAFHAVRELAKSSESEILSYIFSSMSGIGSDILHLSVLLLPTLLATLPSLALALYMRKSFIRTRKQQS